MRKIGLQLAKAIDTIHKKGIVHRDIKPQNILVTDEDEIKICDFSCATYLTKNEKLSGAIGTL
jgi:serine/threonine protein kinase